MTSDNKAEANRRNALKSTGPRTPEGKAAVHLNALRHGLRSEQILLPGEDKEALRELDEHLRAELDPHGELERLLLDRIVAGYRGCGARAGSRPASMSGSTTRKLPSGRNARPNPTRRSTTAAVCGTVIRSSRYPTRRVTGRPSQEPAA